MKWYQFVWQILVGIITVIIAIAAVSTTSYGSGGNSQGVLMAGILIVLLQLSAFARSWAISTIETSMTLAEELNKIKEKLGLDYDSEEQMIEARGWKTAARTKMIIPAVTDFILWVVAIFLLLGSLD